MFNDWKQVYLCEIGEIITGKTPKTSDPENYGNEMMFLTPSDNLDLRYINETKRMLSDKGIAEVSNKVLPKWTVCVSCIGSDLGKVVILKKEAVTNQQFNSIIPNNNVNYLFLYYQMRVLGKKLNYLSKTSTAVPIINKKQFSNEMIELPKMEEQEKIASLLSSLDDKIENNNAIISNLEEQAQAIFKSWFIDFEPFQDGEFVDSELGKIPAGWEVRSLYDIADFKNGLAMQKYRPDSKDDSLPVLKIKELRANSTDKNSDRCIRNIQKDVLVIDGDVIFSWSGSLLVELWTGGKAGLNQHLFKVTSNEFNKWFYFCWTKFFLERFQVIARDRATTMGHIKISHLKESKVLIPNKKILNKMDLMMNPIIQMIINLGIQNRKIGTIRDTLLPKLMSGEIRVGSEELEEVKNQV